jgi:L-alanine-DL-glutamate epimerase-like enolase superfamily enzyme
MLRIERIDTFLVDLSNIRPRVMSMATMHGQTIVVPRIHCADGIVGLGEGTTIDGSSYGDESPESIKLAIDTYMAPVHPDKDWAVIALCDDGSLWLYHGSWSRIKNMSQTTDL